MISTPQIISIAVAYLCLLFLIAYMSDKNQPLVISSNRKALVYSFSLAIYCTSWTFYGAVGSAAATGWGYLPIYLGPFIVYTLGWRFLKRFIRIGHENNTTSISDFIASRYGKSQLIAAIVTLIAVIAIIPYISLQLKAITMSIQVFGFQQDSLSNYYYNSLFITCLLIVFSILFGTRNIDVTEHQYGMMNAIAFESIVKLIAFCAVGSFALYTLYDGPLDLLQIMVNDEKLRQLWFEDIDLENFITVTLLAAAAIFCLPRQFHVSVVEFHQEKDLRWARWIFPSYLVLISLFVIPIVIAGSQYFSTKAIHADTYILALPLAEKMSTLSALVFIGGLSAATGMVIVATVALSTMISNDLVLPVLLHKSESKQFKDKKLNQKMLMTRRISIAACLFLAYIYYRLFDHSQSLASIGFLSFTAVLQFFPALFLGMFWSKATKLGAISGLLIGTTCWFILTWLPSTAGYHLLASDNSLTGLSILSESLYISLILNTSSILIVSKYTRQSLTEKIQAYAYTQVTPDQFDRDYVPSNDTQLLVKDLKSLTASIVGKQRMIAAFDQFYQPLEDSEAVDKKILRYTENILSSSIGASSARVVILSAFKDKEIKLDDVIKLLSSTSQALKFNRRMIEVTMANISQAISVSDREKNIIAWNHSYEKLMNYPKNLLRIGVSVAELIRYNAGRGFCGSGSREEHIAKRLAHLDSNLSYRYQRTRNDGIVLEITGSPLPAGGYVTTYTDITQYKNIESALKENERQVALYTDNSPALLAYLDKSLIYRFVNIAMANSLQRTKVDIIGQSIENILSAAELHHKQQYIDLALNNHKQQFEYSSNENYYLVTYIPNQNTEGDVVGIYTMSQDISNRRNAELALKNINVTLEQRVEQRTDELNITVTALEAAKAEAEKANRGKSRFLAAASHDLLQPFNAARLFSEMLKTESSSMTDYQASLVEKTDQSLNLAENIIRSLSDISKLDSGTVRPRIQTFNIHDTLDSLDKQFSEFADNKNIRFKVVKPQLNVVSDPELLHRILQNFISNAIRYTRHGGVLVGAQQRSNMLRISVFDTGIGIPEEHQHAIFNEFYRLSGPNQDSIERGLGLGLSISERLAKILDHRIDLRSEFGRGSAFHLWLPRSLEAIKPRQTITHIETLPSSLSGTRVLCIDNELHVLDAMNQLLSRWGCQVETGQSTLYINNLLNKKIIPDILLVDYQLDRGETGIQFIDCFQAFIERPIPAIIITADRSEEVTQKVKDKGLQLLHKPLKPAALRATMNSLLRVAQLKPRD